MYSAATCTYTVAYIGNNTNMRNPFSIYRYKDMGLHILLLLHGYHPTFACMLLYAFWCFVVQKNLPVTMGTLSEFS